MIQKMNYKESNANGIGIATRNYIIALEVTNIVKTDKKYKLLGK